MQGPPVLGAQSSSSGLLVPVEGLGWTGWPRDRGARSARGKGALLWPGAEGLIHQALHSLRQGSRPPLLVQDLGLTKGVSLAPTRPRRRSRVGSSPLPVRDPGAEAGRGRVPGSRWLPRPCAVLLGPQPWLLTSALSHVTGEAVPAAAAARAPAEPRSLGAARPPSRLPQGRFLCVRCGMVSLLCLARCWPRPSAHLGDAVSRRRPTSACGSRGWARVSVKDPRGLRACMTWASRLLPCLGAARAGCAGRRRLHCRCPTEAGLRSAAPLIPGFPGCWPGGKSRPQVPRVGASACVICTQGRAQVSGAGWGPSAHGPAPSSLLPAALMVPGDRPALL